MAGDLVYFVVGVPDAGRGQAFYGALLGWRFSRGNVPDGHHLVGVTPPGGLQGRPGDPAVLVYFGVPSLAEALARVRALGGEAGEIQASAAGGHYAHCRDDQGTAFGLYEAPSGGG
jgi:predicted enzyme related to lactoylglutathione lyase